MTTRRFATAAWILLTACSSSSSSEPSGSSPGESAWTVREEGAALVLSHPEHEASFRLGEDSSDLRVELDGWTYAVSADQLATKGGFRRRPFRQEWSRRMAKALFEEGGEHVRRHGDWRVFEADGLFAFRHSSWPIGLGAAGKSSFLTVFERSPAAELGAVDESQFSHDWWVRTRKDRIELIGVGDRVRLEVKAGSRDVQVHYADGEMLRVSGPDMRGKGTPVSPSDREETARQAKMLWDETKGHVESAGAWRGFQNQWVVALTREDWSFDLVGWLLGGGRLVVREHTGDERVLGTPPFREFWWLRSDEQGFTLESPTRDYAIRLPSDSSALVIERGAGSETLSEEDVVSAAQNDRYLGEADVREWQALWEKSPDAIETRGGWRLLRGERFYAFKHEEWSFGLAVSTLAVPGMLLLKPDTDGEQPRVYRPVD